MSRLPDQVYDRTAAKGVKVFKAGKDTVEYWNRTGLPKGHPRFLCGHYWYAADPQTGRAISEEVGPFHTKAAAFRDAFLRLGLTLRANPQKSATYLAHPTGTRAPSHARA